MVSRASVWVLLIGGIGSGCGDEDGGASAELEIAGQYQDDFGSAHAIDSSQWSMDAAGAVSRFAVLEYSNAGDFLVAQNDGANAFAANLFSRFDWTARDGDLWFCQSAFNAETREAATAASADASDPATTGCGGFAWSRLTPAQ